MIDELIQKSARFLVLCAEHYTTISIATAFVVFVIACVLLLVRSRVLTKEDWVLFLGLAYFTFFAQYGLRTIAVWFRYGDDDAPVPALIDVLAQAVGSNVNSFCFLLAALALLYRLPRRWHSTWILLALPFVVGAALGLARWEPWDRVVDASLSASSLFILGVAMSRNSGPRERRNRAAAWLNIAGGAGYAAVNVFYGLAPALAQWPTLSAAIRNQSTNGKVEVVEILEKGAFGIAFGFKVTLFAGAFLLIVRRLLAFSPAISPAVTAKSEMANIVISMGERIGADAATLCVRIPGTKADEVHRFKWTRTPWASDNRQPRPSSDRSVIGKALISTEIIESSNWKTDRRCRGRTDWDVTAGMLSFVNVPLLYDGANIGVLSFEWKDEGGYTATEVQRVRQIADYVTPVVQAERWLYAIADLRKRLQHYNFAEIVGRGDFIGVVVNEIQDVLSPAGTFMVFNFGFRPLWATAGPEMRSCDDQDLQRCIHEVEKNFRNHFGNGATFIERPIELSENLSIGKIVFAIERTKNLEFQPPLMQDERQLDAIIALVKDVIIDLHGIRFGGLSHKLHSTLDGIRFASESLWRQTLVEAAKEAGLRWLTVYPDRLQKSVDDDIEEREPAPEVEEILHSICSRHGEYVVCKWTPEGGSKQSVVQLELPLCRETLYVGVERNEFGPELDGDLPWRRFLDRFVDAADSSLDRIRAIALETEALEFEMNDLLVHELKTPGAEVQHCVEDLEEILASSPSYDDDLKETLNDLKQSAQRFLDLASAVVKPLVRDTRPAVSLSEVREHVDRSYKGRLAANSIELKWALDQDSPMIKVPLHLAYLVIGTLVQNSRDAIGKRAGVIQVQFENHPDRVLLHVDDDGAGIESEIQPEIFKLGFTTKRHGTGRGLPLARRALNRHQGDLLTAKPPIGFSTRFTIQFPMELT